MTFGRARRCQVRRGAILLEREHRIFMLVSFPRSCGQALLRSSCVVLAPWHLVHCLGKRAIAWGRPGDAGVDWHVDYLACIHARGRDVCCYTAIELPVNVRTPSAAGRIVVTKEATLDSSNGRLKILLRTHHILSGLAIQETLQCSVKEPHQAPPSVAQRLGLTATIRSKPLPSRQLFQ